MLLATEIYNVLSNMSVSNISETISRYTYIKSGLLELCIIYDNEISYILCISNKVASAWIIFEDEQTHRRTDTKTRRHADTHMHRRTDTRIHTHPHTHTHIRTAPVVMQVPEDKNYVGKKIKTGTSRRGL